MLKEFAMDKDYINEVYRLFYLMYEPHQYEGVCGYDTEDGKHICVFQHRKYRRPVHVYVNEKGVLMPYFPKD